VQVAEATALLDVMSGGRFLFGVGQGYRKAEFESLGISRPERSERLAEAVQAIRTLWTGQTVSFEGRFYRFEDVSIRPTPIQQPGPPVWVGTSSTNSPLGRPDWRG
jgi:alkanesulfonate monooxygenase SsuD/methylene tetrahydromethanopterin reductase-like flavin-dependent oxidoreductase (luciferase family)